MRGSYNLLACDFQEGLGSNTTRMRGSYNQDAVDVALLVGSNNTRMRGSYNQVDSSYCVLSGSNTTRMRSSYNNFLVNSVDGEVTCGDALKLDWENFTFFKIDKVRNLATGAVLSTYWQYTLTDVEKVSEKRQKWWLWVYEHGWIKYRHIPKDLMMFFDPQIDAQPMIDLKNEMEAHLPTEIKMGEDGQLTLF